MQDLIMPFVVGENIGPYRITQQLGQGGMATVFKAYHAALDRYVAIKAMHPAFMENPNFLARFQREAQVVARLDHPNIVPIYDYAEYEKRPYLVMKFIEGETLKARLARGALPEQEILTIVESVSAALTHAHAHGILHRDIKPSNVLLAQTEQIFLADFGLARIAEAGASTLSSDVMLGTPQYISPEQAMGKQDLDTGTDIYSFGVMLYEIVTGQVPFSADTPYSIIHDHIYTPLPLPRSINPGISEAVERVLLKALAKDREDRFESVASLADSFAQALNGSTEFVDPVPAAKPETRARPVAEPLWVAPGTDVEEMEPINETPRSGAIDLSSEVFENPLPPVVEEKINPRQRWRWWYGIPLFTGLCLCGFFVLGLLQNNRGINGGGFLGTTESPPGQPVEIPPGQPSEAAPQVLAARRVVEENPEDPFAYLELAAAYLDVGDFGAANETMGVAAGLAGRESPEFYLRAGDLLIEREQWYLAVTMYLQYVQLTDTPVPPDVRDRLEGAVYLAAEDPRTVDLLENAGDPYRGDLPLLLEIIRARQNLFQGRVSLAQIAINNILRREPDYSPALLLQAEIHRARGEMEPAVGILDTLVTTGSPPWVVYVAEALLVEIKEG